MKTLGEHTLVAVVAKKVGPTVTYTPSVNPLGRQGEPVASRKFRTPTGRLATATKKTNKEAASLAAS